MHVPDVLGNRGAPTADQVRVRLRYLSEGEKRRAAAQLMRQVVTGGDGKQRVELDDDGIPTVTHASAQAWKQQVLRSGVIAVEGYQRRGSDGEPIPIATADDLIEYGEAEIIEDVLCELWLGLALSDEQKILNRWE